MAEPDNIEEIKTWLQKYKELEVSVSNSAENLDHKVYVQHCESMDEDEVVKTADSKTSVEDCQVKGESGSTDIANSKEVNIEIKIDPDNLSLDKEYKIKLEPDSEPEDLGEIPFVEEVCEDNDDFHEPVAIAGLSHEPKMEEGDSKHGIKVKQENFELDWKPYRTESECGKPKCKECGNVFTCMKTLKMHVRNVHILKKSKARRTKKEMKFIAELSVESRVKKQIDSVEERSCMICGKIFNKKSKMKMHLVLHTKVYKNLNVEGKPLMSEKGINTICLECGKLLGKAWRMKSHIAQVHYKLHNTIDFNNMENYDLSKGGTALKWDGTVRKRKKSYQIFLCGFCEKQFKDRPSLRKHNLFLHEGIS